jgi:cytochrome c556
MRRLWVVLLAAATLLGSHAAFAEPVDSRFNLRLTPKEQAEFLAEMRVMLGSVQGIVQGIADEDREAIARFARLSGNPMARATPATVRARLPDAFKELGGPTHLLFEEIAIRAETDEMVQLTRLLGETLNQCMACHAAFRAR